jgi:S-formylglutathione hydrolase FrmB
MKRTLGTLLLACGVLLSSLEAQGQLILETVHGFSLEGNLTGESPDRTVAVYLPPSYAQGSERRYPVLYLLHGIGGTQRDWTQGWHDEPRWHNLQDVMDRGIAAGRIAEMIVVAPDELTKLGGGFYTNSEATGGWEDFTVFDLVGHVDETYRTRTEASSRGIAGHSMGGYGAIMLGMKHPDVYQVVYGINPALLGWGSDLTLENTAWERTLDATPATLNPRQDFYPVSLHCVAQAFSPNAGRAPLFDDLPFERVDGELREARAAHDAWTRHMPLYLVEEYRDNLLALRGLRFDSGRNDEYPHIPPTNLALSLRLEELGVPHVFEDYNGDHRDRMWGEEGRMATEVLPYFSRLLAGE